MSLIYPQNIIDQLAKGPYKMDTVNGQSANVAWLLNQDPETLISLGIQYTDVFPEGHPNAGLFSIDGALAFSASSLTFYDKDFNGTVTIEEYSGGDSVLGQLAKAVDDNANGYIDVWEDASYTMLQDMDMNGVVTKEEMDSTTLFAMSDLTYLSSTLKLFIDGYNLEGRTPGVLSDLTAQVKPLVEEKPPVIEEPPVIKEELPVDVVKDPPIIQEDVPVDVVKDPPIIQEDVPVIATDDNPFKTPESDPEVINKTPAEDPPVLIRTLGGENIRANNSSEEPEEVTHFTVNTHGEHADNLKGFIKDIIATLKDEAESKDIHLGKKFKSIAKESKEIAEDLMDELQDVDRLNRKLTRVQDNDDDHDNCHSHHKSDKIEEKIQAKQERIQNKLANKLADTLGKLFQKAEEKGIIQDDEAALQDVMQQLKNKYGNNLTFDA